MKMLISAALCLSVVCVAAHGQTLLVANQGNATVSVLDPNTGSQLAVIEEKTPGVHGHEIVATADGRTAFLPIYGSTGVGKPGIDGHEMLIIDVPSRRITGRIDFGHGVRPHQPVLDAAHNLLYVTSELDNAVTIVDPGTQKIIGKVPTGQPESHMLVLSHDGRRGYTANVGPGTVSELDLTGRKTVAIIPISHEVQRIAISNDDRYVFTSDQTAPRLAVIDTTQSKVVRWVDLPGTGYGAATTPDGRWLLVCIPSTNEVAVVDLKAMKVARTVQVPSTPQEILIPPGGKIAYVSCNTSGKVAAIELAHWTVARVIAAGPWADGLAWAK